MITLKELLPKSRRKAEWYMDGVIAIIGAVGTFAVTVIGALGIWWIRILTKRHQQEMDRLEAERRTKREEMAAQRREKKDSVDELRTVLAEVRKELVTSREEIHSNKNQLQILINREAKCQVELAAAVERIEHLENRLEEEGIKVKRKWGDSKVHAPLSSETPEPPPLGESNV